MPIAKTAYVDESLRVDQGLYVLAAVIIADADSHRQAHHGLLCRRQIRLHWRDESRKELAAAFTVENFGSADALGNAKPGLPLSRRSTRAHFQPFKESGNH